MRRIRRHAIGLFLLAACLASPAWAACRDAVVLVHGNTGSPSDFANTYAALLARGYAPDEIFRPSWGSKTCAACNDHDGSEEPPVAAALADALDRSCTGRIDVIAHSMGVTLAAREILRYGLAEDVLPAAVLSRSVDDADAIRELLRRAAVAYGIGTARDFADYYRIKGPRIGVALQELEDAGELIPVQVPGWESAGRPLKAWLHRDARKPRSMEAMALLSPFDPVVWFRDRALRMFGFHYRIEIYTPAPQRVYGYYSLPILVDDCLVGRIDLKSDRQARVLRIQSAWTEPDEPPVPLDRLLPLLAETAAWQGLERVEVADGARGDLAPRLADALRAGVGFGT